MSRANVGVWAPKRTWPDYLTLSVFGGKTDTDVPQHCIRESIALTCIANGGVLVSERRIKNIRKPDRGFLQLFPHHQLIRFQILGSDHQAFVRGITGLTVHHAVTRRDCLRYGKCFVGPIPRTGADPLRLHHRSDRRQEASRSLYDVSANRIIDKATVPNRVKVSRATTHADLVAALVIFEGDMQGLMDVTNPMPEGLESEQSTRVRLALGGDDLQVAQNGSQNALLRQRALV
jgi:hypothetical protein